MSGGKRLRDSVLLFVSFVALAAILDERSPAAGQESHSPQAAIKVEAPSVVVDVIVTDKKGQHVRGLMANNFAVYEDNVPQKIVAFESPFAESPQGQSHRGRLATPEWSPSPQSTTPTQTPKAQALARNLANVRFITIVIDLGDLGPGSLQRACDATTQYVQKYVAADDLLSVYWIDQALHLVAPFTRDKREVLESIQGIAKQAPKGAMTSAEVAEVEDELQTLTTELVGLRAASTWPDLSKVCSGTAVNPKCLNYASLRRYLWTQSTFQARAVFVALRAMAQSYQDLPGRKNVVVFSGGFLHSPDAKQQMASVIDAANRANVAIYVVDSSGLSAGYGAESHGLQPTVNQEAFTIGALEISTIGLDKFDWAEHLGVTIRYDDLSQVAAETGGFLIKNQNDLLPGLAKVDSDLREFYTLVYQPANKNYDGSFRRIRVELLKPGYHLRYRAGYWAIPSGQEMMMTPAAAQLLAGVASGSLQPAFAPRVNAAVLLAPDGHLAAPLNISIPAGQVKFSKDSKRDLYRSGITLLVTGRDTSGSLTTVYQRFLGLDLTKKQLREFQKKPALEISARLAVSRIEPLNLQAILQLADGTVAIGERKLLAKTSAPAAPRLTSILLTNHIEPASGSPDPSDPLRGPNFQLYLPAEPRFSPSDKLTVYFGVADLPINEAAQKPTAQIRYAIRRGNEDVSSLSETALGAAGQRQLLVLKQFDLRDLAPGNYSLEVTAVSGGATTTGKADFAIERGAPEPGR